MQRFVIYAICAAALYGLTNVIIEQKFSKYNTLTLMITYIPVILILAIAAYGLTRTTDPSFALPQGQDLWLLLAVGILFFAADYLFVGAYTNGGDLLTITTITLLFPVFAYMFKYTASFLIPGMVCALPNILQVSGYVLAATGVWLVVKGGVTS